jgi:hypothetical protein
LVVTDFSGLPTGPIFKGQAVLEYVTERLSRKVGNYQSTLRNNGEERRSHGVISLPVEVVVFSGNKAEFCLII